MADFRLNAQNLFLTWPQCAKSKEDILQEAKKQFGDLLITYLIASEKHQDGTPHIHAYLHMSKKLDLRKHEKLDAIGGKHGNYQSCRSPKNVMQYCIKGGDQANWIANFDVERKLAAMTGKHKYFATELIKAKRPLGEMLQEMPEMAIHAKAYKYAMDVVDTYEKKFERKEAPTCLVFYGPPGGGKTYHAKRFHESFYAKPKGDWWQGYDHQQVVILDEFDKSKMSADELLTLLSEMPMQVPTKGGFVDFNSPTVILIGTTDPENWFDNFIWPQFERRIKEIRYFPYVEMQVSKPVRTVHNQQ